MQADQQVIQTKISDIKELEARYDRTIEQLSALRTGYLETINTISRLQCEYTDLLDTINSNPKYLTKIGKNLNLYCYSRLNLGNYPLNYVFLPQSGKS